MFESYCPACKCHRSSDEHKKRSKTCSAELKKEAERLEQLNGKQVKREKAIIPFGWIRGKSGQVKKTEFL